jgi:Protoheme ferro-lyase (ferrochelatase)
VHELGVSDVSICYQSRVGPLKWIGPATDSEIRRAGGEGKGVIIAPVAFVSEHSETLVELDIEYAHLAKQCGVRDYIRIPTVGAAEPFIAGLAGLVRRAVAGEVAARRCPARWCRCGKQI